MVIAGPFGGLNGGVDFEHPILGGGDPGGIVKVKRDPPPAALESSSDLSRAVHMASWPSLKERLGTLNSSVMT